MREIPFRSLLSSLFFCILLVVIAPSTTRGGTPAGAPDAAAEKGIRPAGPTGAAPDIKKAEASTETVEDDGEASGKRKIAVLSYKMPRPAKINRLTVKVPESIPPQKRAKEIEISVSEIESDDESDWIAAGRFELPGSAEVSVCSFEPQIAQFIRVRILKSHGPEVHPELGAVSIGSATFRIEGGMADAQDGSAIASAEIRLSGGRRTLSDAKGKFAFDECDFGTLEIAARAHGYLDAHQVIPVFSGKKVSITFKMKKHSFAISGRVSDSASEKPVALAEIGLSSVQADGQRKLVKTVMSDELGFYYFESCPEGDAEIKAAAEDYADLSKQVRIDPGKSYTINFIMKSLTDGKPFEVLKFEPRAGAPETAEIRLTFSRPLAAKSLKTDNFTFEYHESSIEEAIERKQPVDAESVAFDPSDATGRTIVLRMGMAPGTASMPALDLNLCNIFDAGGRPLSEEVVLISNYPASPAR